MRYIDLLEIEHPEVVNAGNEAEWGCPQGHDYEASGRIGSEDCLDNSCSYCWHREVPDADAEVILKRIGYKQDGSDRALAELLKAAKSRVIKKRAILLTQGEYNGHMDGDRIKELFDQESILKELISRVEMSIEEEKKPETDWSKIEIDTKVLVSGDGKNWRKRHFAGCDEYGNPTVFGDGQSSWTDDGTTNYFTNTYTILASEVEIINDDTTTD